MNPGIERYVEIKLLERRILKNTFYGWLIYLKRN